MSLAEHEKGKVLDARQIAFNSLIREAQLSMGRDIAAVIALRSRELLLAYVISAGKDLVRGEGRQVLVQLPKMFEGQHEKEYLLRAELTGLMEEPVPEKLHVYFFYHIHALKYRVPVQLIGVKRRDEPMDVLNFFTLTKAPSDDFGRTVTLGKQYLLPPLAIRLPSGQNIGNHDRLLEIAYDVRYQESKLEKLAPTLEQVWNR